MNVPVIDVRRTSVLYDRHNLEHVICKCFTKYHLHLYFFGSL